MLDQYVQLGQRIELESVTRIVTGGEEKQLRKTYSSKVYDILSEERLEVLMPYEQRKLVLLPVDSEYTVYFYTDSGIFECRGRIVDRYKSNNVFILVVELLTSLRKYQRREYYRYNCILAGETRELTEEEMEDRTFSQIDQSAPMQRSVITDISGGGLRFISREQYKSGGLLFCRYYLEKNKARKTYEVVGKVLSVQPADKRPGCFEYRIQYQNLDDRKREEIIQYIFEEERKNRKKEKGL